MNYNRLSLIALPFFILLGMWAAQCQTTAGNPSIEGNIQRTNDWKPTVYLIMPGSFEEIAGSFTGKVIDSAAIGADGSFSFTRLPALQQAVLLEICVQQSGSRFANKLDEEDPAHSNYIPLILHSGESIVLRANAERFQASVAFERASAEQQIMLQLQKTRLAAWQQRQLREQSIEEHDENAILEHEQARAAYQATLMAFADTTNALFPALTAIRWASPEGDYERMPEFITRQCNRWREIAPENAFVQQLCTLADPEQLPVQTGDPMPDFDLPMLSGDTSDLYQLLGKKLTIIDLWASWCAPCRKENREVLANLYPKYREQGLQIIGYSLDSNRPAWSAAIAKDGASWRQASHLQGDVSPFLDRLRITTIPANFILDEKGTVLAKNLHGAELTAFVEQFFQKK
ncbi:MAG TPA: TlpA disulfide reductase family protein [Saprospiraceae bacterium]|nr:TlpA disulfide reductase family protein [Saprospiraceae bacterium]